MIPSTKHFCSSICFALASRIRWNSFLLLFDVTDELFLFLSFGNGIIGGGCGAEDEGVVGSLSLSAFFVASFSRAF